MATSCGGQILEVIAIERHHVVPIGGEEDDRCIDDVGGDRDAE
jgi:hypothetical protein